MSHPEVSRLRLQPVPSLLGVSAWGPGHGLRGLVAAAHPGLPTSPTGVRSWCCLVPARLPRGPQPCLATHNSCFLSNFTEG